MTRRAASSAMTMAPRSHSSRPTVAFRSCCPAGIGSSCTASRSISTSGTAISTKPHLWARRTGRKSMPRRSSGTRRSHGCGTTRSPRQNLLGASHSSRMWRCTRRMRSPSRPRGTTSRGQRSGELAKQIRSRRRRPTTATTGATIIGSLRTSRPSVPRRRQRRARRLCSACRCCSQRTTCWTACTRRCKLEAWSRTHSSW
mmetsp:Transcript_83910/g.251480  ORF Transcript_83910/g.251480 Transcript_83910/m.251480 type:complete len:200 (-) Transcript_83910:1001-1600(-)